MSRVRAWGLAGLLSLGWTSGVLAQAPAHGTSPPMKAGARVAGPTLCGKCSKKFEKQWSTMSPTACSTCDTAAAGRAMVGGGMVLSGEPTPIGVVRASYNSMSPGWSGPSPMANDAIGRAFVSNGVVSSPTLVAPDNAIDRPHILSHLLGLPKIGGRGPDNHWTQRREMKAAAIAAMSARGYDPNARVTELPANWVFGRKAPRHW